MALPSFKSVLKFILFYAASYVLLGIVFVSYVYLTLPDFDKLKNSIPRKTEMMEYRAEQHDREFSPQRVRYDWIPLSRIPELMRKSVIVSEDASFWVHQGIDWYEVRQSLKENISEGEFARGGSTITQQLVKNLYLKPKKSISRKLKEWIWAEQIEKHLTKSRILELYLNLVEWGDNIYGIKKASQIYFGRTPRYLSLDQMVRLAAVLPNPHRMKPNNVNYAVYWRSNIILRRLYRFNFISKEKYENTKLRLEMLYKNIKPEALPDSSAAPGDSLTRELLDILKNPL